MPEPNLELAELLNLLAGTGQHAQDVEADSLAEGPALANGNLVTLLNTESGGDVGGEVLVALLVTGVLGDVVEVLAANDQGSVHLSGNDSAGQDTATDGDETGEGALLVCEGVSETVHGTLCSPPFARTQSCIIVVSSQPVAASALASCRPWLFFLRPSRRC
jgi:hypothetical protein